MDGTNYHLAFVGNRDTFKAKMFFNQDASKNWLRDCYAVLGALSFNTKAAANEAGAIIMDESIGEVPVDTGALQSTAFVKVSESKSNFADAPTGEALEIAKAEGTGGDGSTKTTTSTSYTMNDDLSISSTTHTWKLQDAAYHKTYILKCGYASGSNEVTNTGRKVNISTIRNPSTGIPVYQYAPIVHEDLSMPHRHGGKAKFLEDPVLRFMYGQGFNTVIIERWRNALVKHTVHDVKPWGFRGAPIRTKRSEAYIAPQRDSRRVYGNNSDWSPY